MVLQHPLNGNPISRRVSRARRWRTGEIRPAPPVSGSTFWQRTLTEINSIYAQLIRLRNNVEILGEFEREDSNAN